MKTHLPIEDVLPELSAALEAHESVVLQAPPGAGKTTVVPVRLLLSPWLGHRKILIMEPRRLAARTVAQRMASLLGEEVGDSVGYRIRQGTKVSANPDRGHHRGRFDPDAAGGSLAAWHRHGHLR